MRFPFSSLLLVVVLSATFLVPVIADAGFGVSPPQIVEDRLVPGAQFSRTIYLVQGNPQRDLEVVVSVDSRFAKEWFSFVPGRQFTIPAGTQQFPLEVKVAVPRDTELGSYKAFVRINTVPEKATAGGEVSIALGGRVDVDLLVGDDVVVAYDVETIEILDISERKSPQIRIGVSNTGNVSAGPAGASFELFDVFGQTRLAFASVEDAFKPTDPFGESSQTVTFPLDLVIAPGEYWGHARIFDDDGRMIRDLRTVFTVRERTFFEQIVAGVPVAIGAVLLIGILFFVVRRRRGRSRSRHI